MRQIKIGSAIIGEDKLFDWCLAHIEGCEEVKLSRSEEKPKYTKPAIKPRHKIEVDFE